MIPYHFLLLHVSIPTFWFISISIHGNIDQKLIYLYFPSQAWAIWSRTLVSANSLSPTTTSRSKSSSSALISHPKQSSKLSSQKWAMGALWHCATPPSWHHKTRWSKRYNWHKTPSNAAWNRTSISVINSYNVATSLGSQHWLLEPMLSQSLRSLINMLKYVFTIAHAWFILFTIWIQLILLKTKIENIVTK